MITNIKREFNLFPNLVGIVTTDNLSAITTAGYFFGTQGTQVELLNNGVWQWEHQDLVLIYYATNLIGWFTYNASTDAFVSLAANGGISNTLPSGDLIVGNSSNIATPVAMSGDGTLSNTGVFTVVTGAITGSKIANNTVDYAQLALDVAATATVSLTAAQIKALYDTPVLLVPAAGAGKLILIDNIIWDIAYGTTQFTAGGSIGAQYGNAVHGAGPVASAQISASVFNNVSTSSFLANGSGQGAALVVSALNSLNTGVYLSNTTADFATGDSTATLYIRYRVITPA